MTFHKDLPYIKDILKFILDIEESIENVNKSSFISDKDKREANVRRIELIGEVVKNISNETRKRYPETEWKKIAGTRDNVIHRYSEVDYNLIWDIIKINIPVLKNSILKIKQDLEKENKK